MNADQKKRIAHEISNWKNACNCRAVQLTGDRMAALLQEMTDAPEVEPVAKVTGYYGGYLSISTIDGRVLPAGTALYLAPPAPSVPDGWRIVPYTPTVQMLERAAYAVNNRPQPSKYEPSATPAIIFWNAMLKYSPESTCIKEPPADLARDAERYRWLTQDHPASETRKLVDEIGYCLSVRGYGATSAAIDAAIERDKQKGGEA